MAKNIGRDMEKILTDETGTPDCVYALVSTCYHLLHGAEALSMFVEDAEEEGDKEVARFLAETRREFIQRAERAKKLLAGAL